MLDITPTLWDTRGCDEVLGWLFIEFPEFTGNWRNCQVIPRVRVIVLADVYDKNEADDLTVAEKKALTRYARETEAELIARMQGPTARRAKKRDGA